MTAELVEKVKEERWTNRDGESSYGEAPPSPSINVGRGAGQSLETVSPPDGASAPPGSTCPICGKGRGTTTTSSGKRLCVAGHVERFG